MVFLPPEKPTAKPSVFIPTEGLPALDMNPYLEKDLNAISMAYALSEDYTQEIVEPNHGARRIAETYERMRQVIKERGDHLIKQDQQAKAWDATVAGTQDLFNMAVTDQFTDQAIEIASAYQAMQEESAEFNERAAVQRQAIERMVELREISGQPIDVRTQDVIQRQMEDKQRELVFADYMAKAQKKAKDEDGWFGDTIDFLLYLLPFQDGFTNYRMTESFAAPLFFGDVTEEMARNLHNMHPDDLANWFEQEWDGLFDRTGIIFENPDKAADWIKDLAYYDEDVKGTNNFFSLLGTGFAGFSTAAIAKWAKAGSKQITANRILNKELNEAEEITNARAADAKEEIAERTADTEAVAKQQAEVRKAREELDAETKKIKEELDDLERQMELNLVDDVAEEPAEKTLKETAKKTRIIKEMLKEPTDAMVKKASTARPSTVERWRRESMDVGASIKAGELPTKKAMDSLRKYRAFLKSGKPLPKSMSKPSPAKVDEVITDLNKQLREIQKKRSEYVCPV